MILWTILIFEKWLRSPDARIWTFDTVQKANAIASASIAVLYITYFLWQKGCAWAEEQHKSSESAAGYLSVGLKAPQQVASDMEACIASTVHGSFLPLSIIIPLLKGSVALAKNNPQLQDWEHLNPLALWYFLIEEGWNTECSQGPGWDQLPAMNPRKHCSSIPTTTHICDLPPLK